jgi:hypothetical protein
LETFFPFIGKLTEIFSNHWQKRTDFSNHWKIFFQSLENFDATRRAAGGRAMACMGEGFLA